MARSQPVDLGSLTILQDKTESEHMDFRKKPLRGIIVFGPAALTGVVTFEVSGNLSAAEPELITWQKLQSGGANIPIGAGEAVPIDFVGWDGLRFASASIEVADRIFVIKGIEEL